MTTFSDKLFEFNQWANLAIIDICMTLDEKQLEVEVEGVYGRIRPTIIHIVRAEGAYVQDVGFNAPWSAEPDWNTITIAELRDVAELTGQALREVARTIDPNAQREFTARGKLHQFPAWTPLNQALNHGVEHRTQLRVLLTKLGVPHANHHVWEFSRAIGTMSVTPN